MLGTHEYHTRVECVLGLHAIKTDVRTTQLNGPRHIRGAYAKCRYTTRPYLQTWSNHGDRHGFRWLAHGTILHTRTPAQCTHTHTHTVVQFIHTRFFIFFFSVCIPARPSGCLCKQTPLSHHLLVFTSLYQNWVTTRVILMPIGTERTTDLWALACIKRKCRETFSSRVSLSMYIDPYCRTRRSPTNVGFTYTMHHHLH